MMFRPTSQDLFFSKNDSHDPRLGEFAKNLESLSALKKNDLVIAGYPDHEGIKLSGGRLGAAEAPDLIRKYFYKMTPPLSSDLETFPSLYDFGNLGMEGPLESRHDFVAQSVSTALKAGARWIGLGGGHDYGYPDGLGLLSSGSERPLVINFDAHLDVRPPTNGFSSGTPFYRLLSQSLGFDFVEVGIQSQCNSQNHLAWAQDKGTRILSYDEIMASGETFSSVTLRFLEKELLKRRPTYLSLDIDGFSSAFAPGCSQAFATGFHPEEFLKLFDILCVRLDVKVLGLYEVSPPLDVDDKTSKLAALVMHRFVKAYS
ncbi:MAG: formimidoylglutamase [Bdellovibrionales bacterium]